MAAALSFLALIRFGWAPRLWQVLPLLIALALITVLDLTARLVPDLMTLPGLVYALVLAAVQDGWPALGEATLGVLVAGGALLLVAVVSRGGVGGGDIKLMAMLGAALGWKPAVAVLAISQLAGGGVVLVLLAVRRRWPGGRLPVGAVIAFLGALVLIGRP